MGQRPCGSFAGVDGRWRRIRAAGGAAIVAATLGAAAACRQPEPEAPAVPPAPGGPKLILIVAVDQLRADYIDRFDELLTGGLRTLVDEGVWFEQARHEHSMPATGPGHATLATGQPPRVHGIIGNFWYDRSGESVYCATDADWVGSPIRLRSPTLGDWLKAADPSAKVFAVSGKDRAAILMAGHEADGAFWYDRETGGMETSSYYYDESALPAWLGEYNASRPSDRYFGTLWLPLPVEDKELADRGVRAHDYGPLAKGFPYVIGSDLLVPGESFYGGLYRSPWVDRVVGRFAEVLIEAEELGADDHTDFLAVSFSALDTVGHSYGPHARETLDTLLRLDRRLQELLTYVDERIGLEHVVVGFSSDHGAAPVPEVEGEASGGARLGAQEIVCLQKVERGLDDRFGEADWFSPGPFLRDAALEATGVARPDVEQAAALAIEACPSVERVWTRSQLTAGGRGGDEFFTLFHNGYDPERSPDLVIQWQRGFVPARFTTTTHATPYDYDLDVPLLFLVPGQTARRVSGAARTMDLAPTLAAAAGVPVPPGIGGRDLLAE